MEKTSRYSWTSRRQGLEADWKDPQAHEEPALADLSQMISPRIKKPISAMMMLMWDESGMYGFRPKFATLTTIRPPGVSTR